MANMSAAESLKAELAAKIPLGRKPISRANAESVPFDLAPVISDPVISTIPPDEVSSENYLSTDAPSDLAAHDETVVEIPPESSEQDAHADSVPMQQPTETAPSNLHTPISVDETDIYGGNMDTALDANPPQSPRGVKRKMEDLDESAEAADEDSIILEDVDGGTTDVTTVARKVNPDGTVEQEDTVRFVLISLAIASI